MCAKKLTKWPALQNIKEKLKTKTDQLRRNGAGKSPGKAVWVIL